MLKIARTIESGIVTLAVSGRIGAADLPGLRELIEGEGGVPLVIDLAEVALVDADVVRFLTTLEARGIRLARCPAYIQEWMLREAD